MDGKKHIKLMHAESGIKLEFTVEAEIRLRNRNFLVLAPADPAPSKGWHTLMADPDMRLCILERAEKPEAGTIFLPVSEAQLQEVLQIYKERYTEKDLSCQRPTLQV